ncbi:binding-protein-dependent transport systems inner membrane component [Paenibacillus sp. J31TS4]|uniref:carbohydrate ABC transporter permease n=1 Tax=Paenibacillus sp. J31TS4 TaxID=2807195 RepID=UPI001B0567FF|nr:sugar ABC transporter permease [Paenibacillus sp. J31TS4]GIP39088.1 binding-protein-dependent transport systems inner membrane component [Paenibacillus sp. J31TS4]
MKTEIQSNRLPRKFSMDKANTQKYIFLALAIIPPFGGYLLFTLYPNILSVYYSFLDWDGITDKKFIGFNNFVTAFHDDFVWRALWHNLIFMIVVPVLVILISLVLGYLIANKNYKENKFLKVIFFFPNVLSTVVIALLWAFIYDGNYGLLNELFSLFGIDMGKYYWLGDERTALAAVIPPWVWGGVGLYVIIFVNSMLAIPKSLYEAAILEGAGHMTRLFKITMPLIFPVIRVSALFLVVGTLKGFEMVLILTNGGPYGQTDVLGLYMFNLAFGNEYRNYGYASAIGMILFVILVSAKLLMDKFFPNDKVEF